MRIEPTKTWLKKHKVRPKQCEATDCHCIIDMFSENGQGQCVGVVLGRNDLDVLRFCQVVWDEKEEKLKAVVVQVMPHEAMVMSMMLSFGCAELCRSADPEYRKIVGKMVRNRTILLNKMRAKGGQVE